MMDLFLLLLRFIVISSPQPAHRMLKNVSHSMEGVDMLLYNEQDVVWPQKSKVCGDLPPVPHVQPLGRFAR